MRGSGVSFWIRGRHGFGGRTHPASFDDVVKELALEVLDDHDDVVWRLQNVVSANEVTQAGQSWHGIRVVGREGSDNDAQLDDVRVTEERQVLNLALDAIRHPVTFRKVPFVQLSVIHPELLIGTARSPWTHSLLLILRLLMNFIATWWPVRRCFATVSGEASRMGQLGREVWGRSACVQPMGGLSIRGNGARCGKR